MKKWGVRQVETAIIWGDYNAVSVIWVFEIINNVTITNRNIGVALCLCIIISVKIYGVI